MKKKIANDTEEPTSNIYRLNFKDLITDETSFKTITANNPDEAIGRLMDILGGGFFEPEDFWNKYKITAIIEECA